MDVVTIVGYLAALCSMTSFAPQAWKVIKSRDTNGISAPMYAVTVIAFALWFSFGVMKGEWPIIVTNIVCFLLARRRRDQVADTIDPESSKPPAFRRSS